MIDVDGIRQILKDCHVYDKENSKNFIISCPYCGDKKRGSHKHSHCYVSKDDNVPVFNCFYCQTSGTIRKLLKDLTGKERDDLIIPINNKNYVKRKVSNIKKFNIPEINTKDFPLKSLYIKRRTFGKLNIETIPNLVFDIEKFFSINDLDINKYFYNEKEKEFAHTSTVAFLSKRNTILYCRSVQDENVPLKFKKVVLQKNEDNIGLDYYSIDNIEDSNLIVLSEGNFDILGCYSLDTLGLKDKCKAYCSGCTFSYEQLLKSACLDYGLYRPDVILLSDSDKTKYNYSRFLHNIKDFVNTINIYYNCYGKDFGNFPQKAVKIF